MRWRFIPCLIALYCWQCSLLLWWYCWLRSSIAFGLNLNVPSYFCAQRPMEFLLEPSYLGKGAKVFTVWKCLIKVSNWIVLDTRLFRTLPSLQLWIRGLIWALIRLPSFKSNFISYYFISRGCHYANTEKLIIFHDIIRISLKHV